MAPLESSIWLGLIPFRLQMFEVKMLFGDKLGMCSIWHLHPLQCTTCLESLILCEGAIALTHGFLFSFLLSVLTSNLMALCLDFCNVSRISLKRTCFFVIKAMPLTTKDRRATTSILKLKIDTTFASQFWPFKNVALSLLTIDFKLIQLFHIMSSF